MASQVNIELEPKLFNPKYLPYLDDVRPIQIFFGGSSSGKSKFLSQRTIRDILNGERNYLCARNTAGTIKGSMFTELYKVVNEWGLNVLFSANLTPSDMRIKCANGNQIVFRGLDDVEKVKSITVPKGNITDIWIEEATEIIYDAYKQLTKRLRGLTDVVKRITMSFNPILKSHWIYETFFGFWNDTDTLYETDQRLILKTTYKDNKFLTQQDIDALEQEQDSYFYEVYTLGNWGMLGDMVFDNWEIADLSDKVKIFDIFNHGLDFGYSNDPTAYNKNYYHKATKTIYIYKEYANKGVTNEEIASDLKPLVKDDIVICDSAEPKSIAELNSYGLSAAGAEKGKDSILHGIQWLKKHKIIIDKSCQNTINNFKLYHWLKDRQGNVLNKPVDRFNDFIDALRYSLEVYMVEFDDDIIETSELDSAQADW